MEDGLRSGRRTAAAIAQARVEALVLEYQTKLARYLRRMVGDAEVALDLTQDVFLSAFRMLQADPSREAARGLALPRRDQRRDLVSCAARRCCGCFRSTANRSRAWRIDERSAASVDLQAALVATAARAVGGAALDELCRLFVGRGGGDLGNDVPTRFANAFAARCKMLRRRYE